MIETAKMPTCTMKIFSGKTVKQDVAENVKIGDPLTMVISINSEDIFGLFITDCLVRDGLGWGDQRLIDQSGYVQFFHMKFKKKLTCQIQLKT